MYLSLTNLEKCTGAMLASAIGDALGWPNEFRANNIVNNQKRHDCFIEWTRRCRGTNWHYEKILPGEYSDDTQMVLAVARSIITGNWESVFANKELPYWLKYQRGGGRALLKAANYYKQGKVPWQSANPSEYFNAGGNGAVMRILPHVIVSSKKNFSSNFLLDVIKNSIITHGHPRAILGATCYAYALDYLQKKKSVLEYGELITAVLEGQSSWGAFPDKVVFENWIETTTNIVNFDYKKEWNIVLTNMVEQLGYIRASLKKGLMVDDNEVLTRLGCFGKINGAGDVAVLAAMYLASKYANNPILGIKIPAYLTGIDTDTVASITGGLLGMLCGVEWIPMEWKSIQDYDCILRITKILLSDDMAEAAKKEVANIKKEYDDWESTPIGKMRLVDISILSQNKNGAVLQYKKESTLGQTMYFKEVRKDNDVKQYDSKKYHSFSISQSRDQQTQGIKNNTVLELSASDIIFLVGRPELQKITFKKILKITERILTTNDSVDLIAKQEKVDSNVIELLKKYVKQ